MQVRKFISYIRPYSFFHIPNGQPDVFLFSTPRSGSTWLMELIASQAGIRYCNEPFNLRKEVVRDWLQISDWKELYSPESESKILAYLRKWSDGRIRDHRMRYPRPPEKTYHLITHRTCFKILHGCENLISKIKQEFKAPIIFLIRHPIPVAISRQEFPRLPAFLESELSNFFPANLLDFGRKVIAGGSHFEKGILDWCLQNYVPLKFFRQEITLITYEQMVLDPDPIICKLQKELGISKFRNLEKQLFSPSGSVSKSDPETRERFREEGASNREWLIRKWHRKINDGEVKRAFDIINRFEIDMYCVDSDVSHRNYWL